MKKQILLVVAFATVTTGKLFAERNRVENFNNNKFSARASQPQINNNATANYHAAAPSEQPHFQQNVQPVQQRQAQSVTTNFSQQTTSNGYNERRSGGSRNNGGNQNWGNRNNGSNNNSGNQNTYTNGNWDRDHDNRRGNGGGNWNRDNDFRGGEHEHRNWSNNNWYAYNNNVHNRYAYFNGRQFYLNYNCSIYPTLGYNTYAVCEQNFDDFMYELSMQDFESYKTAMALDFVRNHYLNSNQVYAILQQFDFENNRLCVAKTAFRNVIDKQNFYEVFDEFSFENSKYALYKMMNYGC